MNINTDAGIDVWVDSEAWSSGSYTDGPESILSTGSVHTKQHLTKDYKKTLNNVECVKPCFNKSQLFLSPLCSTAHTSTHIHTSFTVYAFKGMLAGMFHFLFIKCSKSFSGLLSLNCTSSAISFFLSLNWMCTIIHVCQRKAIASRRGAPVN